jgi:lysine 2,3-aminomutase
MLCIAEDQDDEPPLTHRESLFPGVPDEDWNDWHWQFRNRITSLTQLARYVTLPEERLQQLREVTRSFRMGITPYYLSLADPADPHDPIARQSLPAFEEYLYRNTGEDDPLHEEHSAVPGLTHRYPDRVLLVISNTCSMYCRHCTRKRIMAEGAVRSVDLDRMIAYIERHTEIRDVIVSGGDPLMLSTARIEEVLRRIRAIPHVQIIRIGTRVPCVLPQRVDAELCEMLGKYHPLWINVQFNHPRECTPEAGRACDLLLRAGIPLNNQSVLLRGVNDDAATMRALIHGLLRMRVRPYYLFQCDPVRGSEHFRTPIARGIEILEHLRGHTSGLAVPTYVIDLPGGGGKVPVGPDYLLHYDQRSGRAVLRNFQGRVFEYADPALDEAPNPAYAGTPAPPTIVNAPSAEQSSSIAAP